MLVAVGIAACSKPEEKKVEAAPAAPAVVAPAETKPAKKSETEDAPW